MGGGVGADAEISMVHPLHRKKLKWGNNFRKGKSGNEKKRSSPEDDDSAVRKQPTGNAAEDGLDEAQGVKGVDDSIGREGCGAEGDSDCAQ